MSRELKAVHQNIGATQRDGKPVEVATLGPTGLLVQKKAAASLPKLGVLEVAQCKRTAPISAGRYTAITTIAMTQPPSDGCSGGNRLARGLRQM